MEAQVERPKRVYNPEIRTRVPRELREKLEAIAFANDRSLSAEMNRAVRMYAVMMEQKAAQDYREVDRG